MSTISNLDAERALLGGVMAMQKRMAEVAPMVRAEDFADARHVALWETLLELDADGRAFDTLTVSEALKGHGRLGTAGGLVYLSELDSAAPSAWNALEYARIVAETAARRRAHALAAEVGKQAASGEATPAELVALAQSRLLEIMPPEAKGGMEPASVVLDRALGLLEAAQKSGGGVTGLPTGFADLDAMTTGMHPGELSILAARPGMGKTSLALNIACHVAQRVKRAAAVFSLEMPSDQLMQRALSSQADVPLERIRSGRMSDYDLKKINDTAQVLWGAPLHFDETPAITLYDVRNRLRIMTAKGIAPSIAIVDYLQLMGSVGRFGNREQEVATNSRGLKQIAKEFGIPLLVLAQLSRKAEERTGAPKLSDLRESGAIEQDADVVMFLARDEDEDATQYGTPVDLHIAKQRNGPVGRVRLLMRSECVKFLSRGRE